MASVTCLGTLHIVKEQVVVERLPLELVPGTYDK